MNVESCPPTCKGHRRYLGGPMDGTVEHMASVTESDFPMVWRYQNGSYERDLDGGTEALYTYRADGGML